MMPQQIPQTQPTPPKRAHTRPSPSPLRTSIIPTSSTASSSFPRRASTTPAYITTYADSGTDGKVEDTGQVDASGEAVWSASGSAKSRPKSILSRILRTSTNDQTLEGLVEGVGSDFNDQDSVGSSGSSKRRSTTAKWEKRASRKAPPPPNRLSGLDLTRQSVISLGGTLVKERDESEQGQQLLPQVFLIPPEEEETKPISLYPPPPPPSIPRPALIHFPESNSRPTSLYSMTAAQLETKNTWGGMANSFGKPPPVFKRTRQGAMVPRGVVMPKKKEEVVRDRERRMSMYTQDELEWSGYIESSTGGVVMTETQPPRRIPSPPPTAVAPPPLGMSSQDSMELPTRSTSITAASRSTSELVDPSRPAPPRIMITSDSSYSLWTEDSHAHPDSNVIPEQEESSSDHQTPEPDSSSQRNVFESEALEEVEILENSEQAADQVVESPISFSPPQLPEPLPTLAEDAPPQPPVEKPVEISAPPKLREQQQSSSPERDVPTQSPQQVETQGVFTAHEVASAPVSEPKSRSSISGAFNGSISKSSKSRNRRSMSLTSILAPKSAASYEAPPLPPVPTDSARPVVRKQKSLKKFFFSTGDLAKEERGMEMPQSLPKEKENKPPKERKSEPPNPTGQSSATSLLKDKQDKKDKGRSSFSMMPKSKSKPSLRIDVRAKKGDVSPAPASAPISASHGHGNTSDPHPEMPTGNAEFGECPSKANSTPAPAKISKTITKRFSLSNMSQAFKRSKKESTGPTVSVPQVPDLPDAYRQENVSDDRREREVRESAVPLSPTPKILPIPLPLVESPQMADRPLLSPPASPRRSSAASDPQDSEELEHNHVGRPVSVVSHRKQHQTGLSVPGTPTSINETASMVSDTSSTFELENELNHVQLMLISPRTRRNPAESLQDIIGVGPLARTSTVVELGPTISRRSVEAIVLGPLLIPGETGMGTVPEDLEGSEEYITPVSPQQSEGQGRKERFDSESSLESLSRSSSTSDPSDHPPPVTPSSPPSSSVLGRGLPPPLPVPSFSSRQQDVVPDSPASSECLPAHRLSEEEVQTVKPRKSTEGGHQGGLFRFFTGSPKTNVNKPLSNYEQEDNRTESSDQQHAQQEVSPQAYSALNRDIQLKSLHFDTLGLDLDFDGYGFVAPPLPMPVHRSTGGNNALGLLEAVEIEEMA